MSTHAPHLTLPISKRDHVRGPMTAPATLLEHGDYQCPYCGAAHPVVEEVRRRMRDELRFVYRHFPLTNIHPRAQVAAEAAEAAGAQGLFWPMHDMLYEHQDALEDEDLVAYAQALGLDLGRFVRELSDGTYTAYVRQDFMSGVRSGVNGTPTFFINGLRYDGARDPDSMVEAIQFVLEADEAARQERR